MWFDCCLKIWRRSGIAVGDIAIFMILPVWPWKMLNYTPFWGCLNPFKLWIAIKTCQSLFRFPCSNWFLPRDAYA